MYGKWTLHSVNGRFTDTKDLLIPNDDDNIGAKVQKRLFADGMRLFAFEVLGKPASFHSFLLFEEFTDAPEC